jgi:hypothetical protein
VARLEQGTSTNVVPPFLCIIAGPRQTLYQVPATRQQVQEIITHCQDAPVEDMMDDQCRVVGHSHKGVAFVLSQSKANLPSHAKPLAKSLGKVSDDEQYWTILMEHDKVQGFNETLPEDANPELWFKATVNYNKDNNMKVILRVCVWRGGGGVK